MPVSVKYGFKQHFNVPAQKAYQWCTDYTPEDQVLMQEENAQREIQYIAKDLLILTDTFFSEGKSTTKQKLVCLYPTLLSWTSTHVTGPNKYSQFLYQIVTEDRTRCYLKFTALHLDYSLREDTSQKEMERVSRKLEKIDVETWKLLAMEMEKEHKHQPKTNVPSSQQF